MKGQFKKGILELVILQEIKKKELYGYELVKSLNEYYTDVDISSYYTILRRLNQKGYIECYEGEHSGGPRRKYYRITLMGEQYLSEQTAEWTCLAQINRQLGLA